MKHTPKIIYALLPFSDSGEWKNKPYSEKETVHPQEIYILKSSHDELLKAAKLGAILLADIAQLFPNKNDLLGTKNFQTILNAINKAEEK